MPAENATAQPASCLAESPRKVGANDRRQIFSPEAGAGKRPRVEQPRAVHSVFHETSVAPSKGGAVFVEIFAGCARLSRCAKQQGFQVIPVDGPRNEHTPECPVLTLDLTDEHAQECLIQTLNVLHPAVIHIALPCGTGSRAREKPIAPSLVNQGAPVPRPLRNQDFPLGFPWLTPYEELKVHSANMLAKFVVFLLQKGLEWESIVCIENPLNSWMWVVLQHFVNETQCPAVTRAWNAMFDVVFSNCAHGGERPKQTLFRVTHPFLQPLAKECPGNHKHKPYAINKTFGAWKFDTAGESEYPLLLCQRFVALIKSHLVSTFSFNPQVAQPGAHQQSRKHRALIPEYHRLVHSPPTKGEYKLLPPVHRGDTGGDEAGDAVEADGEKATYGVYHTPKQFVSKALELNHPFDDKFAVEDLTRVNVFSMLTKGKSWVAHQRLNFARRLVTLSKELAPEEARFHLSLPEHAREVLKGKRLLLFKHLLQESGCPDLEAFDLMQGVHLVGVATRSPFFGDKIVPATTTPEFAVLSNKWQRKKIEAKNIHADDPELSKTLWETIMQEVDRGFLQGPYESLEEVHQVLEAKGTVCSRRFAIMQSGKPRIIDDLKESGVNRAFTAVDRLTLHDIDYVTSFCHFITTTIKHALESSEKTVEVKLKDGSILRGSLHSDFHEPCVWKGRCIDLSKAYKQIPVSSQSRKFAVLMVHHFETERPVYFLSRSLPFGASASVFGFNRISKSLWHIATKGCLMMGGVFFDDFPIVEPESLCSLASKSVEGLLKALGWQYSDDPKKVVPFDYAFDVLGTRIDVSGLRARSFSIENKQSRLERIDALLKEVQEADATSKRQAQVIHGNLNFAMSFFLGHTMRIAARAFAALTMDSCKPAPGQITDLCTWARGVLQFLAPKVIDPSGDPRPVVLFTDAAYEDDVATWGMVLLDPVTDTRTAVGGRVPDFLVQKWHALGSDQVITLAEAFAALLARIVFRSYISQRRVLIFVDNEGARHCLIKATSQTLALLQIVQLFHGCAEVDRCIPWIERVPSASNVADLPSRNKTEEAMAIIDGSPWTSEVDVEAVAEMCCNFNGLPRILTKLTCNAFEASFDPLLHDDNTGD